MSERMTVITFMMTIVGLVSGLAIGSTYVKRQFADGVLTCVYMEAYGTPNLVCYNPKKCDINGCEEGSDDKL